MSKVIYVVVTTYLFTFSLPSYSIGSTEQGVLYGVFGTLFLQHLNKNTKQPQYNPNNTTSEFPPFRCNGDTVECSYQLGKWERDREDWLKAKDVAYRCGRYGECD